MGSASVSVRWRRHSAALAAGAAALLGAARLADVTLVAGGVSVRAHRLLLAATSRLFSDIFDQNPHDHPIIVLNNISSAALHAVLFYIYNGEVSVSEEYLPTLIQAAEYLQIKGLSFDTDNCDVEKVFNSDENTLTKEEDDVKSPDSTDIYTKTFENFANANDAEGIVPKIEPLDENVETIMRDGFESTLSIGDDINNIERSLQKKSGKKNKRKRSKIGKRRSETCKRVTVKTNKENESLTLVSADIFEQHRDSLVIDFDKKMECTLFDNNLADTIDEEDLHEDACFIEDDIKKDIKVRQTFPCPFCVRVYHSWGYRRRHIKAYHETNSLTCKFCLVQLDSEVAWFDHIVKDHGIRRSEARESLVIMVEAHTVLSSSSPPSPISMLNHLRLDVLPKENNDDPSVLKDESCEV